MKQISLKRNDLITGHIFIALPFVTRAEWKEKGFDTSLASPNIIFADDLEPKKLRRCLERVPAEEKQPLITDEQFKAAIGILQGTPALKRDIGPEPIRRMPYNH